MALLRLRTSEVAVAGLAGRSIGDTGAWPQKTAGLARDVKTVLAMIATTCVSLVFGQAVDTYPSAIAVAETAESVTFKSAEFKFGRPRCIGGVVTGPWFIAASEIRLNWPRRRRLAAIKGLMKQRRLTPS